MGADPLPLLLETTLAGSLAMLMVLALRRPVRRVLGAGAAYVLWSCVPVALVAVMLPRAAEATAASPSPWRVGPAIAVAAVRDPSAAIDWQLLIGLLWLAGALATLSVLAWQQRRFRRALGPLRRRDDGLFQSACASAGLPAVAGVLRPRILLPVDFDRRYTADEQALVVQHERLHVRRGDLFANALSALLRCLFWFNPLLPFASRRFRLDQELACDEAVIARNPRARRQYGEAMLKTQFDEVPLPLGCHWQARHPLKERIDMLKRPTPTPLHWVAATLFAVALSTFAGYAAWAAQPADLPAGAKGGHDELFLLARQDSYGRTGGQEVHSQWVKAGEPAVSVFGAGPARWKNSATVESGAEPGTALVRLRIERGEPGTVVAEPALLVRDGEEAAVEQREDSGEVVYRSQFVVLPLRGSREDTEARMRELLQSQPGVLPADAPVATKADNGAWDLLQPVGTPMPPRYPAEAARNGVAGEVILLVDIDAQGRVTGVEVESATPPGVFDATTIAAARQWRFEPALRDGRPVAGRQRVPVTFSLDPPETEARQAP